MARVRDGQVEMQHPRAAEFAERLRAFLDTYGWRSDVFGEFDHPSWREDPSTPLVQLKGFLRKEDAADPLASHRQQGADRERLTAELAARLSEAMRP